jgi:hypothetical protein
MKKLTSVLIILLVLLSLSLSGTERDQTRNIPIKVIHVDQAVIKILCIDGYKYMMINNQSIIQMFGFGKNGRDNTIVPSPIACN